MLSRLHRRLDKTGKGTPVLSVAYLGSGACPVRLTGADLQTWPSDETVPPLSVDLGQLTVLGAAALINGVFGYQASVSDMTYAGAPAVCMIDTIQDLAQNDVLLYGTTVTWCLVKPIAVVMDQAADDMNQAINQLDPRLANSPWLEIYGRMLGIPRPTDATGAQVNIALYRRQIATQTLAPMANNVAITMLLRDAVGVIAQVTDSTAQAFTLGPAGATPLYAGHAVGGVTYAPLAPGNVSPYGFTIQVQSNPANMSAAGIMALINRYRAPGTVATLIMPA